MSQPANDARFAAGVQLFNQGSFFETHDVWEQVWKNAEGEEKTFYQRLIQAAAALLHVQRGNSVGAISVYLKSRPKLDPVPAVWMGVELGQLRSELAQHFDALLTPSEPRSGISLSAPPGQIAGRGHPPGLDGCLRGFRARVRRLWPSAETELLGPLFTGLNLAKPEISAR